MVIKLDFMNRDGKRFALRLLTEELIRAGKVLAEKDLLPATSGNLSIRSSDHSCLITSSGKDKAKLNQDDFLEIDFDANPIDSDQKTSAESLLHTQIYKFDNSAKVVLHAHSSTSVVLSKIIGSGKELRLDNYELLKALSGVDTHRHVEILPIFRNTQNIKLLAAEVDQFMRIAEENSMHAYLIEGHGIYTWGKDMNEALRHMEALETLLKCELERIKIQGV